MRLNNLTLYQLELVRHSAMIYSQTRFNDEFNTVNLINKVQVIKDVYDTFYNYCQKPEPIKSDAKVLIKNAVDNISDKEIQKEHLENILERICKERLDFLNIKFEKNTLRNCHNLVETLLNTLIENAILPFNSTLKEVRIIVLIFHFKNIIVNI